MSRRLLAGALFCFTVAGVATFNGEQAAAGVLLGFGVIMLVLA